VYSLIQAARVGCHPSTLHEALGRYGLVGDWKCLRKRRLRRARGGQVPAVWARRDPMKCDRRREREQAEHDGDAARHFGA
jgi:hypothetical protein